MKLLSILDKYIIRKFLGDIHILHRPDNFYRRGIRH